MRAAKRLSSAVNAQQRARALEQLLRSVRMWACTSAASRRSRPESGPVLRVSVCGVLLSRAQQLLHHPRVPMVGATVIRVSSRSQPDPARHRDNRRGEPRAHAASPIIDMHHHSAARLFSVRFAYSQYNILEIS